MRETASQQARPKRVLTSTRAPKQSDHPAASILRISHSPILHPPYHMHRRVLGVFRGVPELRRGFRSGLVKRRRRREQVIYQGTRPWIKIRSLAPTPPRRSSPEPAGTRRSTMEPQQQRKRPRRREPCEGEAGPEPPLAGWRRGSRSGCIWPIAPVAAAAGTRLVGVVMLLLAWTAAAAAASRRAAAVAATLGTGGGGGEFDGSIDGRCVAPNGPNAFVLTC